MYSLNQLRKMKIGVFCGGFSKEREISLKSGENVFKALKESGLNVVKIDPAVDGLRDDIDIAYLILHGKYGEDGTIQGWLEIKKIPYTGPGVLASAMAMNKVIAKEILVSSNIKTPKWQLVTKEGAVSIKPPLMVKPCYEGSSIGITLVKKKKDVKKAIKKTIKDYKKLFVEEYIKGDEITVGILGEGKNLIILPILMLKPKKEFYDYEAKYTKGMTEFLLPAPLSKKVYKSAEKEAVRAYNVLGCRGVSRIDMIVDRKGNSYVIDINTAPGMTVYSDLPAQAKAVGMAFKDLVLEILKQASLDSNYQ